MNDDTNSLGGRLPLLKPADLDGSQRKLHDILVDQMVSWANKSGFEADTGDGSLIGPFNPLLYSPHVGTAFVEYLGAERQHTGLSATVREVIILSVGAVWHSAYELYAHSAVAEKAGLEKPVIDALAAGQTPDRLTDEQKIAHNFARQLAAERRIDPDLYGRAVAVFGETGVVNMIHLIGLYMSTSALLNAFAVPVPVAKS